MTIDEIKQLMFTTVIGKRFNDDDYKGFLIGYDDTRKNQFLIRIEGGSQVEVATITAAPVPNLRPYKNSNEIPLDKIMARLKTWRVTGNRCPVCLFTDGVNMNGHEYTYEYAAEKLEWVDGSPFGIVE